MIQATELSKSYGGVPALNQLTLEVPRGSVFGLLGPNGAGKTTFLKLVMGFLFPDGGQVTQGVPRWRIGYLPERAVYPQEMQVRAYLRLVGRLAGLRGAALRDEVGLRLEQMKLGRAAGRSLGACSRGVQQRVGLAQALLGDPPLLLLDEPASNLDPKGQALVRDVIAGLHAAGTTVLLSSHRLDEVTRVCTHVAILERGRLARTGLLEEVLAPSGTVVVDTGDLPQPVMEALVGIGAELQDGRIQLQAGAALHKAAVLRLLLDNGVDIRGLSQVRHSLEEIYLKEVGE